jgi:hypothetical protein
LCAAGRLKVTRPTPSFTSYSRSSLGASFIVIALSCSAWVYALPVSAVLVK